MNTIINANKAATAETMCFVFMAKFEWTEAHRENGKRHPVVHGYSVQV